MSRLFFSPESVAKLTELVCDKIEPILDDLDVKYTKLDHIISGTCPVHNGDNPTAFNLFLSGDTMRGNWICYTRRCQLNHDTPRNVLGLIRGILKNKYPNITFYGVLIYCCKFLKIRSVKELEKIEVKPRVVSDPHGIVNRKRKELKRIISRASVRKRLIIPAEQLVNKGLSREILDEYDVGFCPFDGMPMSNRIVVPIYDDKHEYMIGCVGRSIYEKCPKCEMHHKKGPCPEKFHKNYAKWVNSPGFKATSCLYNYWAAKDFIQKSRTILLVEGQWDCLKLVQAGIKNVVGIFGDDVSDEQFIMMEKCGVFNIVPLLDNDKAGQIGKQKIIESCANLYNVIDLKYPKKDVGELNDEEIREYIAGPLGQIH